MDTAVHQFVHDLQLECHDPIHRFLYFDRMSEQSFKGLSQAQKKG